MNNYCKIWLDVGAKHYQDGKSRDLLPNAEDNWQCDQDQALLTGYDQAKKISDRAAVMKVYPQFIEEFDKLCNKYQISLYVGDSGGFSMQMADGYYVDIESLLYGYRDDLIR